MLQTYIIRIFTHEKPTPNWVHALINSSTNTYNIVLLMENINIIQYSNNIIECFS